MVVFSVVAAVAADGDDVALVVLDNTALAAAVADGGDEVEEPIIAAEGALEQLEVTCSMDSSLQASAGQHYAAAAVDPQNVHY